MPGEKDLPDINVLLFRIGPDYCITHVNQEVLTVTGLEHKQVIGRYLAEFKNGDRLRITKNQPLLSRINNLEFSFTHRDGSELHLDATAERQFDESGAHQALTIVAYDISPRTKLLKENNRVVRELEHTKSELQNFAELAVKDLGEPLRIFASLFGSLRKDLCGSNPLELNMFEQARTHTLFMYEKIKGLMELSLIDISPDAFREIKLGGVISQVAARYAAEISALGGEFQIGSLASTIKVSSGDLASILSELIDNSIKFSNPEVPLKLSIWSEIVQEGSYLELCIQDNGLGMPPLSQIDPRLPFVRLHQSSSRDGPGIGLTRCNRLIRKFSGKLDIESTLGQGTIIKMLLKIQKEPVPYEKRGGVESPLTKDESVDCEGFPKLDAISRNLPVMMAISNPDQVVTDVNAEFSRVTGFSLEECVGEAASAFLLPEDQKALDELALVQETQAQARGVPLRMRCRSGKVIDVELFNQRFYDADGKFGNSLNTLIDVTARNDILRSQSQMRESMIEGNHALAEFSGVAARELKQPLNMLESFLCMIRPKAVPGSKSHGDLEQLDFNLAKINALVEDLLILARVNLDPEDLRQIDLGGLFEATIAELEADIQSAGAEVLLQGEFPIVHITSSQLGVVVKQLISNSLKYRSAERAPIIKISCVRSGNGLEIRVTDNGKGLEAEQCEYIFDAFRRVGSGSECNSTGMGLAICRRVMEQLGGSIDATGEPDVGSEFHLWFPDYANFHGQKFSAM